jgi:pre-mRNA-splicing factor CWC22
MNRYIASKKKEECGDRLDHDGNRKRRFNRGTILHDESGKEKKRSKREGGDEIKKGPRIYHKDENGPSYSRRRANRSNLERDSKYQYERFDRYERYWDKNDSGSHHEKESNNRYQSKCLAPGGTRSRNGDNDSTSKGKEKKVKSDDSVQNRNINTKYDSQGDTVTNTSSPQQKRTVDLLTSRTGGAYIPPAKLRMMQAQITDKSSAAYQRIAWEALKKSIHGHINKVNTGNIAIIVRELLKENIVRGRGLLCRSIIQAQAASPSFTHVYAALVAVINSKVRLMQ